MPTRNRSPIQLKVPVTVGPRGEMLVISNPAHIAEQEIRSAVLTYFGQRLMRPDIGTSTMGGLFSATTENDMETLAGDVRVELDRQITRSRISDVVITAHESTMYINVRFTVPTVSETTIDTTIEVEQ